MLAVTMVSHLSNGCLAEQYQLDAAAGLWLRGCVRHCMLRLRVDRGVREDNGGAAAVALRFWVEGSGMRRK